MRRSLRQTSMLLATGALLLVPGGFVKSAWAYTPPLVTGVVSDSSSFPLANVRVEVWNQGESAYGYAFTDAYGAYTIDNLTQETYLVRAHLPGYSESESNVNLSQAPYTGMVNIQLTRLGIVAGSIYPATTGVHVSVFDDEGENRIGATTDSYGAFLIDGLPSGTYTIVAHGFAAGMSTTAVSNQTVVNGQTTNVGTLTLATSGLGTVSGLVEFDYTYGTGTPTQNLHEPAEGYLVKAMRNGIVYGYATTSSTGSYSIPRLPPASDYGIGNPSVYYTEDPDGIDDPAVELMGKVSSDQAVSADSTTTCNLILERGGGLCIRVMDSEDQPLSDASFSLTDENEQEVDLGAVDRGNVAYYPRRPLPAGTYTLAVSRTGYLSDSTSVTVVSGARKLVTFVLQGE